MTTKFKEPCQIHKRVHCGICLINDKEKKMMFRLLWRLEYGWDDRDIADIIGEK